MWVVFREEFDRDNEQSWKGLYGSVLDDFLFLPGPKFRQESDFWAKNLNILGFLFEKMINFQTFFWGFFKHLKFSN